MGKPRKTRSDVVVTRKIYPRGNVQNPQKNGEKWTQKRENMKKTRSQCSCCVDNPPISMYISLRKSVEQSYFKLFHNCIIFQTISYFFLYNLWSPQIKQYSLLEKINITMLFTFHVAFHSGNLQQKLGPPQAQQHFLCRKLPKNGIKHTG